MADNPPQDATPEPESSYSHDATVAAITNFYKIIDRGSVGGWLKFPPPEGWPQITPETFRPMGRSSAVIKLLKHLPYFTKGEPFCIMDHTECIDYTDRGMIRGLQELSAQMAAAEEGGAEAAEKTNVTKGGARGDTAGEAVVDGDNEESKGEDIKEEDSDQEDPDDEDSDDEGSDDEGWTFPPYMIHIARHKGRYGYDIYIDTSRGAASWVANDGEYPRGIPEPDLWPHDPYDSDAEARETRYREELYKNDPQAWRWGTAFRVETFFEHMTQRFLDLKWMSVLEEFGEGSVVMHGENRRKIMRDCGWPGEGWDKERAIRELEEYRQAHGHGA